MSAPSPEDSRPTLVAADWVLPLDGPPIHGGAVLVNGGRILQVGREADLSAVPEPRRIRYPRCAIIPGLINCHIHLEHSLSPAIGDGIQFQDWLGRAYELLAMGDEQVVFQACAVGVRQALRGGVTALGHCGVNARAVEAMCAVGMGGVAFLEVFGIDERDDLQERLEDLRRRVAYARQAARSVRVGVSPHSAYTAGPRLIREVDCFARDAGLPMSIHAAEWGGEIDRLLGREPVYSFARRDYVRWTPPRTTPVRYLQTLGVLRPGTVCAHCVQVDAEEVRLLGLSGCGVAVCPRSNALHGHGLPPLLELIDAGAAVGIGTDGAGSVGRTDMFEEMRWAMAAERARRRQPDAILAREVLRLATVGSAAVLGLAELTGSLTPGRRADLVCVGLPEGSIHEQNVEAAVVLCGGPTVKMTMVGGVVRWNADDAEAQSVW